MEVNIQNLIDDARCYEAVRDLRWPEKTTCPHCASENVIRRGKDDVHYMASILRSGVVDKKPKVKLSGEVECDEVYVVAGHKGNPDAVKKRGD
jgi:hypothetical protein